MNYQYICVQCGKEFVGKTNPNDPLRPHPSYYRKKNPSFHYCPSCQEIRQKEWLHQYHLTHGPQYTKKERKQLFYNDIRAARSEWREKVATSNDEPDVTHIMWDYFPARKMENNELIPAINLIGTVTNKELVTQDSNGRWIRPKAILSLEKERLKYQLKERERKRHKRINYDQYGDMQKHPNN